MSHREIDARTLKCPFIPGIDTCLTKSCMAWRWTQGAIDYQDVRTVPVDRTMDREAFKDVVAEDRKKLQKRGFKMNREATPGEVFEHWHKVLGEEREGACARVELAK